MPIAATNHIEIDDRGVARIAGTRVKVRILVEDMKVNGHDVDDLIANFPHLTRGQVFAALSYYYDHPAEMERQSADADELVERSRANAGPQPTRAELEARLARKRA